MVQQLRERSLQLLSDVERAKQYHRQKQEGQSFSFEGTILPFVNEVQERVEVWRGEALAFAEENAMNTLNAVQIEHTYENMYVIPTESFQAHVREKRYEERIQAIYYVMELLFDEMNEKSNAD
ncbi:hypothetical protein JCM19037_706 [Geomicrobium sp. JCM 19037]|uniref:DUF1798 family protein n=1 Tax=unclassified Geomicrobium TaxID=2628951 RepID=UPI00045F47A4|nr:DUF1798 family protein [Geomicrobium sp. JCM 19037]GAK02471.1 hypothetical protein JCM19037_706 [Geomicrobium sp. JCM 19037]